MRHYILTYRERGSSGEWIQHREVFFSKIAARINMFFTRLNKRRGYVSLYTVDE